MQEDITETYLTTWAESKYKTNDYFLNFVKTVFKTENFLLIYKYLRHPLPSARLINDKIKTPLKRVFYSEDPFFKYEINGDLVKHPEGLDVKEFDDTIFNALLFRHNDILVTDLDGINSPFRSLISIDNVVNIDSSDSIIRKIAYSAQIVKDGETKKGILYIDTERYLFFEKDDEGMKDEPILDVPHDLGRCPADYVSAEPWSTSDIIRKSIFSYTREEMEEYVFLKTMQRMVEASGVVPTVTMLDVPIADNKDAEGENSLEPMTANEIGSQKSSVRSSVSGGNSVMETGNVIKVPLVRKEDGSVEMDVVTNYLNFFYIPKEQLDYLNSRIKEVRQSIVSNIIGDYSEGSTPEGSKSNDEINKVTIVSKQDKLRELASQLSRIRTRSDFNMLALKHGKENVNNQAFYGSDFFLETQKSIYELIKLAPNPIEEKSLLMKSARNRNRFNQDNFTREYILYNLIPYGNKENFTLAVEKEQVGEITFQLQTRFNYWIGMFESKFGDILSFWDLIEGTENEKIVQINNLITIIIRDNYEKSSASKDIPGEGDS